MFNFLLKSLWISLLFADQLFAGNANLIDARDADILVQTPGGLIPKSNAHEVPPGATVQHDSNQAQIIGSDGSIIKIIPLLKSSSFTAQHGPSRKRSPSTPHAVPSDLPSGWVTWAYWMNPSSIPIAFFTTSWAVPELPASWDGQIVYIFNALEPASDSSDAILQPVLQFGVSPAGGGKYWSIASWYLIKGVAFYTPVFLVTPGQIIQGTMEAIGAPRPPTFAWYSLFSVNNVAIPQTLLSINTTDIFSVAYETLEIYDAVTANDLPSGFTMLDRIRLYLQDFSYPSSLDWTTVNDNADGLSMFVYMNGSTNSQMEITY